MSPCDDEPLPYVELGVVDQQRPLDVLLQHLPVVLAASPVGIHYVVIVSQDDDSFWREICLMIRRYAELGEIAGPG